MPRGAYACRIDENQGEIVKSFRKLGASVLILSDVGKGCPDILVGISDCKGYKHNVLVEIKDGKKSPSQQKLTTLEKKFFDEWKGNAFIVTSIEDVVFLINAVKLG